MQSDSPDSRPSPPAGSLGARLGRARRRLAWGEASGRAWVAPFVSLLLVIFFGDMAATPGRMLLPVYAEAQLRQSPQFTSTLLSLNLLFGAVAAFTGGALCDALGQRRVLIIGGSGLLVVGLVFITGSPILLALMWVYIGLVLGLHQIARQAYMMAVVPNRFLATATALSFSGVALGGALGNLFAGPTVDRYGFGVLGIACTVVALAVFLAMSWALPEAPSRQIGSRLSFTGYGAVLRRPGVALIAAMRFIATAYWGAALMLVPLLVYRLAGAPSAAAYYSTAMFLFTCACQLLAGRAMDRYGCRLAVPLLTAAVGAVSVLTGLFSGSMAGLYIFGLAGAGVAWSLATATPTIITLLSPPGQHGRTLGVTQITTSFGVMLGTQMAGWLANSDPGLVFLILGAANLAMVAGALWLNRYLPGRSSCPGEQTSEA